MTALLLLACALFCLGVYGVLVQKSGVGLLVAVELMINAVNLVLVGFVRQPLAIAGATAAPGALPAEGPLSSAAGHSFALFVIALTVAEVVVGLAILLLLFRARGDARLDLASEFKG